MGDCGVLDRKFKLVLWERPEKQSSSPTHITCNRSYKTSRSGTKIIKKRQKPPENCKGHNSVTKHDTHGPRWVTRAATQTTIFTLGWLDVEGARRTVSLAHWPGTSDWITPRFLNNSRFSWWPENRWRWRRVVGRALDFFCFCGGTKITPARDRRGSRDGDGDGDGDDDGAPSPRFGQTDAPISLMGSPVLLDARRSQRRPIDFCVDVRIRMQDHLNQQNLCVHWRMRRLCPWLMEFVHISRICFIRIGLWVCLIPTVTYVCLLKK